MGNINVYLKTFSKEGKLLTETLAYSVGIMSNPSNDDYAQFEDGTTSKTTDLQLPWLKKDCWFEGDNYTDIKAIDVKFDSSGVSNFNRSPIYISIDNLDEALVSRDYDNLEENVDSLLDRRFGSRSRHAFLRRDGYCAGRPCARRSGRLEDQHGGGSRRRQGEVPGCERAFGVAARNARLRSRLGRPHGREGRFGRPRFRESGRRFGSCFGPLRHPRRSPSL